MEGLSKFENKNKESIGESESFQMLNTCKKELEDSWFKKRKYSIFKILLINRLSKRQPIQSKIDIYFAPEASSNELMQVEFDKTEDKESPGKKTYA